MKMNAKSEVAGGKMTFVPLIRYLLSAPLNAV